MIETFKNKKRGKGFPLADLILIPACLIAFLFAAIVYHLIDKFNNSL